MGDSHTLIGTTAGDSDERAHDASELRDPTALCAERAFLTPDGGPQIEI
jgi:hypothetical protein